MKNAIITSVFFLASTLAARAQCPDMDAEGFTAGSNVGGWTFGISAIVQSAGFPGAHLHSGTLDTFGPELRTTQASLFTGNWRAQGVSSFSVDLQTFALDFSTTCQRPLSLILENDNGTPANPNDDFYVYFAGPQGPCIDGLWHSYSFDVPTQSAVLPAGWALDPNTALAPDVAWNIVMQSVSRVRVFFGDPTFFYIFAQWTVGADNPRLSTNGGSTTYCVAKKNTLNCQPSIDSTGTPSASLATPFLVRATSVINNKQGTLFYGFAPLDAPFQGGKLCVQPPVRRTPVQSSAGNPPPNDCSGAFAFDFNAWTQGGADPALIGGAVVYAQYWARDPASPSTTSLSNAIRFAICP